MATRAIKLKENKKNQITTAIKMGKSEQQQQQNRNNRIALKL